MLGEIHILIQISPSTNMFDCQFDTHSKPSYQMTDNCHNHRKENIHKKSYLVKFQLFDIF